MADWETLAPQTSNYQSEKPFYIQCWLGVHPTLNSQAMVFKHSDLRESLHISHGISSCSRNHEHSPLLPSRVLAKPVGFHHCPVSLYPRTCPNSTMASPCKERLVTVDKLPRIRELAGLFFILEALFVCILWAMLTHLSISHNWYHVRIQLLHVSCLVLEAIQQATREPKRSIAKAELLFFANSPFCCIFWTPENTTNYVKPAVFRICNINIVKSYKFTSTCHVFSGSTQKRVSRNR